MAKLTGKAKLAKVKGQIQKLDSSIEDNVKDEVENQAENLVDDIESTIKSMGLVGDPSDKPGQIPLSESFTVRGVEEKLVVTSTAPHASAIQSGADEHPITPNDATLLSFVPEDSSKYPQKSPEDGEYPLGTWYDPEQGVVFSTGVMHPGNDAYNYMGPAQMKWWQFAQPEIRASVKRSIIGAGFKPYAGGLGRDPDFI